MHLQRLLKWTIFVTLFAAVLTVWVPVWILIFGSFMGQGELYDYIGTIYNNGTSYAMWPLLPKFPTLRAYVEALLDTPSFLLCFGILLNWSFPLF